MPILSTGGYSDEFLRFIANGFNSRIVKCRDYMHFVVTAIDYLNKWTNDCFFIMDRQSHNKLSHVGKLKPDNNPIVQHFSLKNKLYPYLLVNVRSGASFIRVDSPTQFRRLTGSPIGSNLFLGVLRILNCFEDPSEAINAAVEGDSSNIDLSVGDIYGGSYDSLGLPAPMLASAFGKLQSVPPAQLRARLDGDEEVPNATKNDVARSLLTMVSYNALIISKMLIEAEKIENVVLLGSHVDILQYMQMSQFGFDVLTKG